MAQAAKDDLQERFGVQPIDLEPGVYYRLTDDWLELTVRFVVQTHQIRRLKDQMSRHIIKAMKADGIGVASSTYDIVGLPPIDVRIRDASQKRSVQC